MKSVFTYIESPVGPLLLAGTDSALTAILFAATGREREPDPSWTPGTNDILRETSRQLREYFAGERQSFELPLAPEGTEFQKQVWRKLGDIPYGDTISYGELARRMGDVNKSRAVGLANGANPISIVVPCHRVIGTNGKLTGYGGGLDIKEKLLALERRQWSLL